MARRAWASPRRAVPPRPRRGAAGRGEGGGPGHAARGGDRPGRLELEGGAAVRWRALRAGPWSERLSEVLASAGFRAQAAEEAPAEGERGPSGELRAGVRAAAGDRRRVRGQDLLRG